ncbi:MAG: hypothetical protein KBB86_01670 [Candidatus Pacebacteria bacterium]|nr:hypothetical protein [Candidatus Paceibacterota bacterium]
MSKIYEESKKAGNALSKLAARLSGGITEDVSNAGSRFIKRKQNQAKAEVDSTAWDPYAKFATKVGVNLIGGLGRMVTGVTTIVASHIKKQGER